MPSTQASGKGVVPLPREALRSTITLKVDDCRGLKRSWVWHEGSRHATDGTQVSELPVSKQPVNCLGGEPR